MPSRTKKFRGYRTHGRGKKSGRGAYVCRNVQCFKKARKAKRFERSLDCEIPENVYDALESELTENE